MINALTSVDNAIPAAGPFHVLVVDDDATLRNLLETYLKRQGFLVSAVSRTSEARIALSLFHIHLILLDVMLPQEDGYAFLKKRDSFPYVIFLSAKGEKNDRIKGLSLGAYDYITKPFDPEELVLRIVSVLRHHPLETSFLIGEWCFDGKLPLVKHNKFPFEERSLTETEMHLLSTLCAHQGQPLSRAHLASQISSTLNPRSIDVQIARLRSKIENDPHKPRYIQSVRHVGYMLKVRKI